MSILKPLAKVVVAGVVVVATAFAGATSASAKPIDLTGSEGMSRAQVTKRVKTDLRSQLYAKFIEEGATRAQANALATKIAGNVSGKMRYEIAGKKRLKKADVADLESTMERDLERTLRTDVNLALDRGTLQPTLDVPGGLDLGSLLQSILGLVTGLLDSLLGGLTGGGGGVVPELPVPDLPVDDLPVG